MFTSGGISNFTSALFISPKSKQKIRFVQVFVRLQWCFIHISVHTSQVCSPKWIPETCREIPTLKGGKIFVHALQNTLIIKTLRCYRDKLYAEHKCISRTRSWTIGIDQSESSSLIKNTVLYGEWEMLWKVEKCIQNVGRKNGMQDIAVYILSFTANCDVLQFKIFQ
jgi:hypothetical protein